MIGQKSTHLERTPSPLAGDASRHTVWCTDSPSSNPITKSPAWKRISSFVKLPTSPTADAEKKCRFCSEAVRRKDITADLAEIRSWSCQLVLDFSGPDQRALHAEEGQLHRAAPLSAGTPPRGWFFAISRNSRKMPRRNLQDDTGQRNVPWKWSESECRRVNGWLMVCV